MLITTNITNSNSSSSSSSNNNNDSNNTIPGINTNINQSNKVKSKTVLNLRALSKDHNNNNNNNNNSSNNGSNGSNRNDSVSHKEKALHDSIDEFVDNIKEGGYLKIDQITLIVDDIREEIQKEIIAVESLIQFLSKEIDNHTDVVLTSRSNNSDNAISDSFKACVLCKSRGTSNIPSMNIYPSNISCALCKEKAMKQQEKSNNNNDIDDSTNTTNNHRSRVRNKFQSVKDEKYFLEDDVW